MVEGILQFTLGVSYNFTGLQSTGSLILTVLQWTALVILQTTGSLTLTGSKTLEQMTVLDLKGEQGGGGELHSSSLLHLDLDSQKIGRVGGGGGLKIVIFWKCLVSSRGPLLGPWRGQSRGPLLGPSCEPSHWPSRGPLLG